MKKGRSSDRSACATCTCHSTSRGPTRNWSENFMAAVAGPANTPAYVHCAAGGRAAALWMIKRVKADGWTEARALEEANALGLNDRLRPFALDYLRANP